MTEATIRAQIKTTLDAVSGIGRVYNMMRRATETDDRDRLFLTTSGIFHTWMMQLEDNAPITTVNQSEIANYSQANVNAERFRLYQYRIYGYYGVNEERATEITFAALTETVIDALDSDTTLHGAGNPTFFNTTPAQLAAFNFVEFAGVLCHGAQITLTVESKKGA